MTGEYTFVDPARQNELTLRIQRKLTGGLAETPSDAESATPVIHSIEETPEGVIAIPGAERTARPLLTETPKMPGGERQVVRPGSKAAAIFALLCQPGGATRSEVMRITGWEAHSVRGFVSGVIIKKLKRAVESTPMPDGDRLYRILP
jgi:hypothetical protein